MGVERSFVTPLHRRTSRNYLERMINDKVEAMTVAAEFGADYWDGDRRYGYGGYQYRPGYWTGVAQELIETYGLTAGSGVLDVGCGKAFLLHELLLLEPNLRVVGMDVSQHALSQATELVRDRLILGDAAAGLRFADNEFDLVISLAVVHNFSLRSAARCLGEIERVGRQSFVMVESYRTWQELFNLQCWALTCRSFLSPDDWLWLFGESGFTGDYEFIYFE